MLRTGFIARALIQRYAIFICWAKGILSLLPALSPFVFASADIANIATMQWKPNTERIINIKVFEFSL